MKYLITGANGEIGKEIANILFKNKKYTLGLLGNKKNITAKTKPSIIEISKWIALIFHFIILEMTAGPKDDPIAVQANNTLLNIFSGISTAIKAEANITIPVIILDSFNVFCLMPRSMLIDDEQTNI